MKWLHINEDWIDLSKAQRISLIRDTPYPQGTDSGYILGVYFERDRYMYALTVAQYQFVSNALGCFDALEAPVQEVVCEVSQEKPAYGFRGY
jgi:hypothetical protein